MGKAHIMLDILTHNAKQYACFASILTLIMQRYALHNARYFYT